MAKKKATISLMGLDDVDFKKEIDIKSAQSIVDSSAKPAIEAKVEKEAIQEPKEIVSEKAANPEPIPTPQQVERKIQKAPPKSRKKESSLKSSRGTMPPEDKKRASFNISKDLHRALKDYSFYNEIEMVEYIFEQLVKPDLKKKGYYPPKKRR